MVLQWQSRSYCPGWMDARYSFFPCSLKKILSCFLLSVLMWRMDCQWGAAHWTPRPALDLVWLYRPTFLTASGGNPSSTAPTLTLTFHPKVLPGTPPLPVTCKFNPTPYCWYGTSLRHYWITLDNVCLGRWVRSKMCFLVPVDTVHCLWIAAAPHKFYGVWLFWRVAKCIWT